MRETERALLLDKPDLDAVLRPIAEHAGDLIPEMPDDNMDVGDAAVAHHFDLMGEQRTVENRQNRLRAAVGERIHPRALAGRENDADHPVLQITHALLP